MTDEHVLVIPATVLELAGRFTGFSADAGHYLPHVLNPAHFAFRPRAEVEEDPSWLQLVPYAVLRCDGDVFHYTRGRAGTEARLRAKRSVGVGGHVNPCDAGCDPYRAGFLRELAEEVRIETPYTESTLGLIHDPSTPVGSVHLGVVHLLELTGPAVTPREAGLADAGFAPLAELRADRERFESWSQFVLDVLR